MVQVTPKQQTIAPSGIERVDMDEMIDGRRLSQLHDPEGRSEMALRLRKMRESEQDVEEHARETYDDKGQLIALDIEQNRLMQRRERLQRHSRFIRFLIRAEPKLFDIDLQLSDIEKSIEVIEQSQSDHVTEQISRHRENTGSPREVLDAYYEAATYTPLEEAQKDELLTTERLSSLSTEDYLKLWRRLSPHFVSRVFRQGFRDHYAMHEHSAGLGEHHDDLKLTLEDEKIARPMLYYAGLDSFDASKVSVLLERYSKYREATTKEGARQAAHHFFLHSFVAAPGYVDKMAVHFMAEDIGDDYYGGETGNEVFVIYPSDYIARRFNYSFSSRGEFTQAPSDQRHNDVWVWDESIDNPGISLDAGIVFLPDSTPVDPETGSRYSSTIRNIDGKEIVEPVVDQERFAEFLRTGEIIHDEVRKGMMSGGISYDIPSAENPYTYIKRRLKESGFSDEEITRGNLSDFVITHYRDITHPDREGQKKHQIDTLLATGVFFVLPEVTISAKEYWEDNFSKHPEQRPKHVVYYDGDPTEAVRRLLVEPEREVAMRLGKQAGENGEKRVRKISEDSLLGQPQRYVEDKSADPRARPGWDKLVQVIDEIVDTKFT